jgi:hypothetical protein
MARIAISWFVYADNNKDDASGTFFTDDIMTWVASEEDDGIV